ncbi:hypothetical protein H109_00343 [Trichophyton interdigitale MR816]|uniref:Uncharacterized protein n=1 Tax=Trichophyton interdigitale (strain MR816) TaxID=1215338 RepID=A0A059JK60_TRIIM|nr:hypothetical protein H109_00343 [Trichophyton interdigitale MR816]
MLERSNWSGGTEAIPCRRGQGMKEGIARESGGILLGYPESVSIVTPRSFGFEYEGLPCDGVRADSVGDDLAQFSGAEKVMNLTSY